MSELTVSEPSPTRGVQVRHLYLFTILIAIFVLVGLQPVAPYDFWWHLKAGEIIVQTQQIPTTDQFSFTRAGQPYDNYAQFWLVESLLYTLYGLGGLELIIFAHALAVTLAYALVFAACTAAARRLPAVLGLLFAFIVSLGNWSLRPQGFVLPLAGVLLWCIWQDHTGRRPKAIVLAPLILLIWANSHGSWTMGLLLLWIYFASRLAPVLIRRTAGSPVGELRLLTAVVFGASLAILINPRGLGIIRYVLAMGADPVSQTLGIEWVPATFNFPVGAIYLSGFLVCSVILVLSPRRPGLFELLTYLVFGVLGMKMMRANVWFAFFAAPVVAKHLGYLFLRTSGTAPAPLHRATSIGPVLNAILLALFLILALLSTPWLKPQLPLPPKHRALVTAQTPTAAVEFMLQQQLGERVFNAQGFGSYLIWAAAPRYRVFVDPRFELYTLALFDEYFDISQGGPGWEAKLANWGVETLLLSPTEQAGLIESAAASPAWRKLFADDSAVLFTRTGS